MGWWWPAAELGEVSVAVYAWDLLKEVTIIFITSTVVWPQIKKWQPTPVFLPGESHGHGLTKSWTRLSNFTFTFTSNYGGGNEDNGDLPQKV